MIVWLWNAASWRGVCDSLGQAQERVAECIGRGATEGIVRSAVYRMDRQAMQKRYFPTGRVTTAKKVGARIEWTGVHWSELDKVAS
jgi:hypothetical protein